MNNDDRDDATNQPVSLNNEAKKKRRRYSGVASASTSDAGTVSASTIVPDTHILP